MTVNFSRIVKLDETQLKKKKQADKRIENVLNNSDKITKLQENCVLNAIKKGY